MGFFQDLDSDTISLCSFPLWRVLQDGEEQLAEAGADFQIGEPQNIPDAGAYLNCVLDGQITRLKEQGFRLQGADLEASQQFLTHNQTFQFRQVPGIFLPELDQKTGGSCLEPKGFEDTICK